MRRGFLKSLPASLWPRSRAKRRLGSIESARARRLRPGASAESGHSGRSLTMATTATPARCAIPDTPLAAAAAGLDSCVHCGFCMQACPTYLALGDENDSPRGRLVLMRSLLEGDVAASDPSLGTHIDQCLGCRACEAACPSGVPYGALLEATRATLNSSGGRGISARWPLYSRRL